jgi:hypothetical protein
MNYGKFQIPNYKSQTNPKSQSPMTETILLGILDFGHSCLPAGRGICLWFGAWNLVLSSRAQ